jgi:signal transduction histidine kinase
LMQAHGGTLTIVSTVGVGTRARLAFPAERLVVSDRVKAA